MARAADSSATAVQVRHSSKSTAGASSSACGGSRRTSTASAAPAPRSARRGNGASSSTLALVGYTNAGKSTLLNRLTDADVLVEDRLFSTLDPTTRRLRLPGGEIVLLSDTVGFVRRLPHQLVEAFRSTLEEVVDADLLVHVVDGSSYDAEDQIEAVHDVLRRDRRRRSARAARRQQDRRRRPARSSRSCCNAHPDAVAVSAVTGDGVESLLDTIAARLRALAPIVELEVPYERGDVVAALHREGEVLVEVHGEGGTRVRARVPQLDLARFREFVVDNGRSDEERRAASSRLPIRTTASPT